MFWLIKQAFMALLSFSESLATKCVSLDNEPCMTKPTLVDLNHIELDYYSFIMNLDKCNGSCHVADNLYTMFQVKEKSRFWSI